MLVYHITNLELFDTISTQGLLPNSPLRNTTIDPDWDWTQEQFRDSLYEGNWPIFVFLNPNDPRIEKYRHEDSILLEIEIDESQLLPDIGTLIDTGAYLEEDGIWWEEGKAPHPSLDVEDTIEWWWLKDEASLFVEITQTAAVIRPISPEQIKLKL